MERTLTTFSPSTFVPQTVSTDTTGGPEITMGTVGRRLLPLWRYGVWVLVLFATLICSVVVRIDVQSLRKDLDRNARAQVEAQVVNARLRLELDARRRSAAMAKVGSGLQLGDHAEVVDVTKVAVVPLRSRGTR